MARNRRINNPEANSDLELATSDKKIAKLSKDGGFIVGSESNDADNVKIHRAGSSTIQFVTGDDTTTEGVTSPNFATVVFNPADLQQGGTVFTTTQPGHGFTSLDAIYHNGTAWVKAQANASITVATYLVIAVSGDDFTAQNYGRINFPGHGLTVGEYYFCSNTVAGDITSSAPLFGYSNPVLYVEDSNTLHIAVERASLIGDGIVSDSEIGSVMAFATDATPVGFLPCEGQAISRTTYADLFLVVGTRYGNGDGSSTFNVPDLRGRFVRGWDNSAGNDPDAGSRFAIAGGASGDAVGSYQNDATAVNGLATASDGSHSHDYYSSDNFSAGIYPNRATNDLHASTAQHSTSTEGSHTHSLTGDAETRPINVNVAFYIRYLPKGALRGEDLGEIGDIKHSMLDVSQFQSAHGVGWILMDGSSVVGSKYESITGFSSVPDARGEFLRGLDNGRGIDPARALGSFQLDAQQPITGDVDTGGSSIGGGSNGFTSGSLRFRVGSRSTNHSTGTATDANGTTIDIDSSREARTASENRPRNVAVNIFIKVN
jgi:microcystin-dependent protein